MSTIAHNLSIAINLPRIHFKPQHKTQQLLHTGLGQLEDQSHLHPHTQQDELDQIHQLDQWSNSLPTVKRKRNKTSESIVFLYKSNNKYNPVANLPAMSKFKQNGQGELGAASLFLAQMENQIAKIEKINYFAINQNVEYCAGVYEIAFEGLFKKLDQFRVSLSKMLSVRLKEIQQFRERKLQEIKSKRTVNNSMKNSNMNSIEFNKENISSEMKQISEKSACFTARPQNQPDEMSQKVRNYLELKQAIQYKYQSLKPLKRILQKIQKQRTKLLSFSLQLGYDVREEGLTWIIKQLNNDNKWSTGSQKIEDSAKNSMEIPNKDLNQQKQSLRESSKQTENQKQKQKQQNKQKCIPKATQFPSFLTQQQINFIISKYRNNFKLKNICEQIQQKQEEEQQVLQNAFENVRRDRNRKLSMIKERELLEKLLQQKKQQVASGHKYMNHDVLRIMQNSEQVKSTTNELIYQETLRKLNRFCIQEIHGKKPKNEQSGRDRQASTSEQVSKFMHEIKRMLSDTSKLKNKEEQIKSEEERELADIIMKMRHEIYEGRFVSEKRNPISVICCLVGWRKAKKILQNQMSISMSCAIEQSH